MLGNKVLCKEAVPSHQRCTELVEVSPVTSPQSPVTSPQSPVTISLFPSLPEEMVISC
ncbi:hypothetical protein [Sphaerospermopsis reniformis]|uniref:hypothetical protein n=1 Tax=Sphaerospermopsis reniformis TaxID=531300 RepID=UPI001396BA08|nr:hypothetical protein [Sphaerospermopsis reniformis]